MNYKSSKKLYFFQRSAVICQRTFAKWEIGYKNILSSLTCFCWDELFTRTKEQEFGVTKFHYIWLPIKEERFVLRQKRRGREFLWVLLLIQGK